MTIGLDQVLGLIEFASNPRSSPVFKISEEMSDPKVSIEHNHLIRIWRTEVKSLHPCEIRQVMAVLEVTEIKGSKKRPVGLHWSYSKHAQSGYVLHGWIGVGSRRFDDLQELNDRCTEEIQYFLKKLVWRNKR